MRLYRSGHYSITSNHERNIIGLKKEGSKNRTYKLTRKQACLFRSRAVKLFETAEHSPQTQILTYQVDHESQPYQDLNRYLTNLRRNYDLKSYCTALEVTQKNQYHFHLLMDMPRTKTAKLNDAWLKAAKANYHAKNALRDHRKIKSEIAVLKYCSDYLTKKESKNHPLKKFTYSQNLLGGEFVDLTLDQMLELQRQKELRIIASREFEYCTVGRAYLDDSIKQIFDAFYHSEV